MKKSLIALAALAATASFAQSSVTAYGVVDTGYRSVESGTNKFSGNANGSNMTSRLGFKGTEDLGGGMTANFVLEGELAPNDGTAAGFAFKRQSTIGLAGKFGEVRIGRDYTPAFRLFGVVDPFGTVGVGSAGNIMWSTGIAVSGLTAQEAANAAGTFVTANRGTGISTATPASQSAATLPASLTFADPNLVRANNSFAYYSPDYMGFKANLMYSAGTQNTATEKAQGRMTGLSLNYAQGPLTVGYGNQVTKGGDAGALATAASTAVSRGTGTGGACATGYDTLVAATLTNAAYCGKTTAATSGVVATDNQKATTNFLVGSYDFGVAKAGLGYRTEKLSTAGATDATTSSTIYSVSAPMGAVTLKAAYITKKVDITDITAGKIKAGTQLALGAVYNLSKRTALYGTYAELKNEPGFINNVGAAMSAGGLKSKGFDLGVRHSF